MKDLIRNLWKKLLDAPCKWRWVVGIIGAVLLAFLLSWSSSNFSIPKMNAPFLIATTVAIVLLVVGWWLIRDMSPPQWLAYLLVGAALIRLILGVVWYVSLPVAGYDSPAERKGYVMADAYNRDRAAWQFSLSNKPAWKLLSGLQAYKKADQYGGMLFVSSMLYRLVDGEKHQPLLVVVITASVSALAVLFAWAFGKLAFGDRVANIAAWGLALYPEAILLGSSQMREAFLITLIMAAFYWLLRYLKTHALSHGIWVAATLLLCLPFSPPATILVLFLLIIFFFIVGDNDFIKHYRIWLFFFILGILALIGIWIAWKSYAPAKITDPLSLMAWWFRISASMQARMSRLDSGWLQKIFYFTPDWSHFPFMLLYGISRPLLPAAIIDLTSKPLWHIIAIWRALGWTVVLPALLYAPIFCLRKPPNGQVWAHMVGQGLSLVVWVGIVAASLRGGADLWDNPRYRAMFAGIQILLGSWIWMSYRQYHDIWLKRTVVCLIILLVWFVPWYLRRYTVLAWPVDSFFETVGLGVASCLVYVVWDVARLAKLKKSKK